MHACSKFQPDLWHIYRIVSKTKADRQLPFAKKENLNVFLISVVNKTGHL